MIDVVIAGGGPSGLALAALLVQAGLDVRVLEPRCSPGTHSRAIGLHPPALEVLDAVGAGPAAVAAGVPIRRGIGIAGGQAIAAMDFGVLPGPHRYVLSLPQAVTVRLLQERLDALDAAVLLRGARVESFQQADDGVRVAFAGSGTGGSLSTRYLVGADGVNSTVRALLGLPFSGRRYPDHYVMGDYPDSTDFGSTAALILHPEGIVESFPLPGGLRRWVAWRTPDEPSDLSALVLRRTGHVAEREAAGMLSDFRCSRRSVARMAAGRVVLIGDAAHEVSPIGGQGMALGLLDAAVLAPLLVRAVRGHGADRAGSPSGRGSHARTDGGGTGTQDGAGRSAETGTRDDAGACDVGSFDAFSAMRLRAAARAGRQAHLNMMLGRPLPGRPDALRRLVIAGLAGNTAVHDAVAHRFTMSRGF